MKLEDEIKQKLFETQRQKLALNIIYTDSWLHSYNIEFFRKYDLTQQQYNVLRILRGQYPNPVNINLIKDRMLEKMSNASRLVERLKNKGWVDRKENQADRRQADVTVTDSGLALLKKLDDDIHEIYDLFETVTEEEALAANNVLDKLRG